MVARRVMFMVGILPAVELRQWSPALVELTAKQ